MDWQTAVASLGIVVSIVSALTAKKALSKAAESNMIANRANSIATEANSIAASTLEATRTSANAAILANQLNENAQVRDQSYKELAGTAKLKVVQGTSKSNGDNPSYSLRIKNTGNVPVTGVVITQWALNGDRTSDWLGEHAYSQDRLEVDKQFEYDLRGLAGSYFRAEISYEDIRSHQIVVLGEMPSDFQYAMSLPKPGIVFALSRDGARLALPTSVDWSGDRQSLIELTAQQLNGTSGSQEFLNHDIS